jgi:hypothetical protein
MELPGETFLFNLSLLAITFSAVSALVTLLRQAMGGKLSNFDVYLLTTYVSDGFVVAISSLLPPLIAQSGLPLPWVWAIASGLAAAIVGGQLLKVVQLRSGATKVPYPLPTKISFILLWFSVLLLLANASVPAIRGIFLFEVSITIYLATVMWIFVRRIASLQSDHHNEDWDPNRG